MKHPVPLNLTGDRNEDNNAYLLACEIESLRERLGVAKKE